MGQLRWERGWQNGKAWGDGEAGGGWGGGGADNAESAYFQDLAHQGGTEGRRDGGLAGLSWKGLLYFQRWLGRWAAGRHRGGGCGEWEHCSGK